jgi:hypothetical protein
MTMSRDFILVFSGGVVSLVTTLVVLFIMDYLYRRDQKNQMDRSTRSAADESTVQETLAEPARAKVAEPTVQKPAVGQTLQQVAAPVVEKMVDKPTPPKAAEPLTQKVIVDQATKPIVNERPVQKPFIEQPKTKAVEQPSVEEKPQPIKVEKPKVVETPKPQFANQPSVGQKLQPPVVDKPVEKPAVGEIKPKIAEPPVAEQKTQTPVAGRPAEKPAVEQKLKRKKSDELTPQAAAEEKTKPALIDSTPRPPNVAPPERMRKKMDEGGIAK